MLSLFHEKGLILLTLPSSYPWLNDGGRVGCVGGLGWEGWAGRIGLGALGKVECTVEGFKSSVVCVGGLTEGGSKIQTFKINDSP